ncbi:MAG: class I SAM-dependent methyltransferase [Candidatus Aenigmarchaeota archaeon]|nr:class I SAM-dependent methyltransferase [Candidatus Aenigmarchaeota archaeon]
MVKKLISEETEWSRVAEELKAEKIKLAFYDNTVISLLGNVKNRKILDYGGGPGVLAITLKKLGADIKEYDISEDMRKKASEKIGEENIYHNVGEIPKNKFDLIICNLVLCIVSEDEVKRIVKNIKNALNKKGFAFIGFCNPKLLDVQETNLDLRPKPSHKYEENHSYMKTKKEGGYQIIENHRPIEWYERVYEELGLKLVGVFFTPEYKLKGKNIKDFIIFKLRK